MYTGHLWVRVLADPVGRPSCTPPAVCSLPHNKQPGPLWLSAVFKKTETLIMKRLNSILLYLFQESNWQYQQQINYCWRKISETQLRGTLYQICSAPRAGALISPPRAGALISPYAGACLTLWGDPAAHHQQSALYLTTNSQDHSDSRQFLKKQRHW